MTIHFAAKQLGCTISHVYYLKTAGKLRGSHGHVTEDSLAQYMASHVKADDLGPKLPKEAKRGRVPASSQNIQRTIINGEAVFQ